MNKKGQNRIVEWMITGITLLILLFIFYQIGKSFCGADPTFCGIFGSLLVAAVIGVIWFLKFGHRR